ncbi:MAG: chromosomal replication initiator protein DnaA [Proteobacteria bacterium]|nr:chromosomal replication initiator protein DnaA [Pseudomonadota bacterium]
MNTPLTPTTSSTTATATTQAIWDRTLAKLRFRHGDATFNSWIKPLNFKSASATEFGISAPTRFIREWVATHYLADIETYLKEEMPQLLRVELQVASDNTNAAVTQDHETAIKSEAIYSGAGPAAVQKDDGKLVSLESVSSPLDPRLTFENFVVGKSNELAYTAARSIADSSSVMGGSNPLFLYGGVGLGKTHLMHAIALHIAKTRPTQKVVYLSAEKFMYMFIRALRNKDIMTFKEQFRSVDVLMIDDVQFICGKDSTQEEFFHTFNALIDNHRQLVISADRSPNNLEGLEERIRSRLGWGLVADINSTTYELRLGILQSKAEKLDVKVPAEVLEFLAQKITSNVRELEGALNKVVAHGKLLGREITLEYTQVTLSDLLRTSQRMVTVEDIKKAVADHCNVRLADMHSERRARYIARPRQMAMYLSKKLTPHSLPEIGRKFGGRDHTTVMHAVRKIEELMVQDKELENDIGLLTRMLQS